MNKRRFQALVMVCVMTVSIILSGCNNSGKKKGKKRTAEQHAAAMLDDVCAYIKSAKIEKIEKMLSGRSKWAGTLENYRESEVKDVFEAARKRIDYSIEDVEADEKEGEGEALIVFTYFDTKDFRKQITHDSTNRELVKAIEGAKEERIEVEVELVYDDDWLIEGESFDDISEALFAFIEDLGMDTVPAPTAPHTSKAQPLPDTYCAWYDTNFDEVEAYHQTTDRIRLMLSFWDPVPKQTLTYEFEDYDGNITEGSIDIDDGENMVYIDWYPTYQIPVGWISCTIYDAGGTLVTVACVEIIDDNLPLPVRYFINKTKMVDENGVPVHGYHESDKSLQATVEIDKFDGVQITYALVDGSGVGRDDKELYRNTVTPTSTMVELPMTDLSNPGPGEYTLIIYDMDGSVKRYFTFEIIKDGEEFELDDTKAYVRNDCFTWEENGTFTYIYKIPADAKKIRYYAYTNDYYLYMQFTYKVEDGSGTVLDEGITDIVTDNEAVVDIDVSSLVKGPLKVTIYNPDGTVLAENSIEEEN